MKYIHKLHYDRTWRTWEVVLGYANALSEADASDELREAIFTREPHLRDQGKSWISFFAADTRRHDAVDPETAFRLLAVEYQPEFRDVLAYMAAPQRHPELADKVSEFLTIHGHGKSWSLAPYSLASPNLDEDSENYCPVLFDWDYSYQSVLTPLALFLLEQIDEWGGIGRPIPIRQCQRRECGKFMLAERPRRKRYCSNLCGVLDKQRNRSREEWAAYMWLHRMDTLKPTTLLKRKLKQKKTADRLKQIPEQWPQLGPKVKKIRDRAGL